MTSSSAFVLGELVLGLIAIQVVIVGLFIWLWSWVLRSEKALLPLILKLWKYSRKEALRQPAIQSWIGNHPTLSRFVRERLTLKQFSGLPLTLLGAAFLYTISLFLGIVTDYLFGDPLIAADLRIANLLYAFRDPRLLHFFYFITLFGSYGVIIASALLLSVMLWRSRQHLFVFALWLTLIISEGTTFLGKLLIHRSRPAPLLRAVAESSYSFPSGHATTAVAFYGFIAYLIIRTNKKWSMKVNVFFSLCIAVVFIDLSRLYLGVHYVSDVLAGDLVGLAGLLFSISLTEWLLSRSKHPPLFFRQWKLALVGVTELIIVLGILLAGPSPWIQASPMPTKQVLANTLPSLFETATLPLFTETIIGSKQEPTSVIIVAADQCFVDSFGKAHWQLADALSLKSLRIAIEAVLFNREDSTGPMTPSFYDTRPHDFGFEKETDAKSLRTRHHARYWKTDYSTESGSIFVGTVSLDTGIKWGGITHAIAPAIDTERDVLTADLEAANVVASKEIITLIPPTIGKNFTGDQYFTDGKAVVLYLHDCSKP